jgi:anti-anti-sigma factor
MIAQLSNRGEITVISLSGRVDIEKAAHLKKVCGGGQIKAQKLIFCLERLHFVGSSGIQNLFQMMEELKSGGIEVKIAGLNPDFQRLWHHGARAPLEIHSSLDMAVASFQGLPHEIL